mgnify:CR=1 FL=1
MVGEMAARMLERQGFGGTLIVTPGGEVVLEWDGKDAFGRAGEARRRGDAKR